jgi:hypothetical protein
MPTPATLRFHQATLSFLGHKAAISASAVKEIDDAEKKVGLQVPAAVREWYSLAGWEEAIANDRKRVLTKEEARFPIGLDNLTAMPKNLQASKDHIDGCASVSLDRNPFTGKPLSPTEREAIQREHEAFRVLRVGQERGNPFWWGVALDGSDDPPVSEVRDTVGKVSGHFSTFIFCIIWEPHQIHNWHSVRDTRLAWLVAEKHPCGPGHLDFMREHYSEGLTHQPRLDESDVNFVSGACRYPFYNSDGAITIQCTGDPGANEVPAHWSFTAASASSLVNLISPVWQLGGLSKTVQAVIKHKTLGEVRSPDGEKALEQLKGKSKKRR